jgi:hypothetical protein
MNMWETKQIFPFKNIGKASNYSKHKELLQEQFPTFLQTREPVVILTQRAQTSEIQPATLNEERAGLHSSKNKRKVQGTNQQTKQAMKCNRNGSNNEMIVS